MLSVKFLRLNPISGAQINLDLCCLYRAFVQEHHTGMINVTICIQIIEITSVSVISVWPEHGWLAVEWEEC